MALTDIERDQVVTELNMTFFGLLKGVADALTDDPDTPEDESKFTAGEGVQIGTQTMTMGWGLANRAKKLKGEDWAAVVSEWGSRAGIA